MTLDISESLADVRISIVGAGAMGEAIIGGLLRQRLAPPENIMATAPRPDRRADLIQRYGIAVTPDNIEATQWGNVVMLTVKPQTLPRVLPLLRGLLQPDALCLSIAAGVSMQTIADQLEHAAIARAMPNTPAQIGEGMTVWTASAGASQQQRMWGQTVLGALGREIFVDQEHFLDMATALSGSGPAYVFLLMEAMIDAGVHLGFPRHMAEDLVLHTMLGSTRYAIQSGQHPAQLRNAVTSPGGTSAAALSELERGRLRTVLGDGIWAAYRRSCELGEQIDRKVRDA